MLTVRKIRRINEDYSHYMSKFIVLVGNESLVQLTYSKESLLEQRECVQERYDTDANHMIVKDLLDRYDIALNRINKMIDIQHLQSPRMIQLEKDIRGELHEM